MMRRTMRRLNLNDLTENLDNEMSKNALNVAVILTALNLSDHAQEEELWER